MGSERMWLRHFRHKRKTLRYKRFRERYYAYHPDDVVNICTWHHEEISRINYALISARVRDNFHTPCSAWTWEHAFQLIAELRTLCAEWLTKETPGIEPRPKRQTL